MRTPMLCVRCNGQGHTMRPPWLPGDVPTWSATNTVSHPCPPCEGTGFIWIVEESA